MKRMLLAAFAALLAAPAAFAQADLQPAAIVKLHKTEPISVKQLKAEVQKMEAQAGRALTVAERRQVLDVMINEKLAVQAAEKEKIVVTDAEFNQVVEQSRSSLAAALKRAPTDAEFEAAVKKETGLDLAAFKDQVRRQAVVQKYLLAKKKASFEAIKEPTEAEIKDAYELSKSKLVRPDTIRFSLLYVPAGQDADAAAKARALADKIAKDVDGKASKFDEAVVRAQAAGSGYQGGDGGYLPRTSEAQQMVGSELFTAAFALKVGEVSRLVESPRGFYIVKVTEQLVQKTLELGDPYQPGASATVYAYLGNMILSQRQQQALETATKELVGELRAGNPFQVFEKNLAW